MSAKRRKVWLALVLGVLLALVMSTTVHAAPPSPSSPQPQAAPIWGTSTTVTAGLGLRLRQGPSLYDRIILVLRYGETVTPGAGPVYSGGRYWTYVRVWRWGRYYEGFCASVYLASYAPSPPPSDGTGLRVTARVGLRLRWGPGTWYAIYRVAPYGTILQPTGVTQWGGGLQWTQVTYQGYTLWAASMYLQ